MKRLLVLLMLWPTLAWSGDAYFISKNGSNTNAGTSWATAWLTAGKADSTLSTHGDTIVFGTGTWTNTMLRVPEGGSPSAWQIYCCSTYYEYLLGNITYNQAVSGRLNAAVYKTQITSGQPLTGWTFLRVNGGTDSIWFVSFTEGHTMGWSNRAPYCLTEGWSADKADSQSLCKYEYNADSSTAVSGLRRGTHWAKGSGGATYTIFMSPFSGGNPNTNGHTYWASGVATIVLNSRGYGVTKHTTIWGMEIKLGMQGAILFNDGGGRGSCSTFIEQSHITFASQQTGENAAVIMSRSEHLNDTMGFERWVFIRNDSIGLARSVSTEGVSSVGGGNAGIKAYDNSYWHIDSCVIYGAVERSIHFKQDDYGTSPSYGFRSNVISNCFILNGLHGIEIDEKPWLDSIYGNVIMLRYSTSGDQMAILFGNNGHTTQDSLWKYECFVANNTFFNIGGSAFDFLGGGTTNRVGTNNKFLYNIICNWHPLYSGHDGVLCNHYNPYANDMSEPKGMVQIDSNLYWNDSNYAAFGAYWNGGSRTFSAWRSTYGWDTHSDTATNPGLSAPNNTSLSYWQRFSRPSASGEMSVPYGNRTWTKFGAVQEVDSCPSVNRDSVPNSATTRDITPNYVFDISDLTNDTVYYEVLRDTYNPPTTVRFSGTVATPVSNATHTESGLADRTTYFWRITYTDTVDVSAAGGCTETTSVYSYFVDTVKCPIAASVTPANGATVTQDTLRPTASFQTDDYSNIIVRFYGDAGDPTPNTLRYTDTLTTDSTGWNAFKWTGLVNGLTYYWQVVAQDPDCTDSSDIRSFNVVITAGTIPSMELEGTEIEGISIGKANENENCSGTREVGWGASGVGAGAAAGCRAYTGPACLAVCASAR